LPNKTYGYGRVSTQRQFEDGTSKDTQHEDFLRFVHYKQTPSWELCTKTSDQPGTWFFDGAVSSTIWLLDRPAGSAMCAVLQPGDHVVIPLFDRAFRSAADVENAFTFFDSRKVQVHILDLGVDTSGIMGRFVIAIMGAVKRLERQTISERILRGKIKAKSEGMVEGHLSPGWKYSDNKIGRWRKQVPDMAYREQALEVLRLVDEEGMSFEEIAIKYWKEGRVRKDKRRRFNKGNTGWGASSVRVAYHSAKAGFPNRRASARSESAADHNGTSNLGPSTATPSQPHPPAS